MESGPDREGRSRMRRSENRILTSHVGSLPRPADLLAMLEDHETGQTHDSDALTERTRQAIADIVHRQTGRPGPTSSMTARTRKRPTLSISATASRASARNCRKPNFRKPPSTATLWIIPA